MLWEDLTLGDKMKLFGYWTVVSVISNMLQLFGSLSSVVSVY